MARPDALFIPASRKRGSGLIDRVGSIADVAEPLLGTRRGGAYIRQQPNDWLFVSPHPDDTILYPTSDVRSGPRYVWVMQPDGMQFGYLIDEAQRRD
jgi:hypothetical protein